MIQPRDMDLSSRMVAGRTCLSTSRRSRRRVTPGSPRVPGSATNCSTLDRARQRGPQPLHAIAASWPPARRGLGPGRFRWRIRVLAGQIGIDVALLIEPFVRAILRQPRNEKPVAADCFWRANSAGPNVLSNANIKAHRIENHSVVCHDFLIKKEAAPNARIKGDPRSGQDKGERSITTPRCSRGAWVLRSH